MPSQPPSATVQHKQSHRVGFDRADRIQDEGETCQEMSGKRGRPLKMTRSKSRKLTGLYTYTTWSCPTIRKILKEAYGIEIS